MTRRAALLNFCAVATLAGATSVVSPRELALSIRRDLESRRIYDNLSENWTAVESALAEGCRHFIAAPSRHDYKRSRTYWRVLPICAPPLPSGWYEPFPRPLEAGAESVRPQGAR